MKATFTVVVLALAAISIPAASGEAAVEQTGKGETAEEQIKILEAQQIEATLKGDASSLEKYASDDYVAIRGDVKATINGKPYSGDVRATRVWVRQKNNWKLVTHQATRVIQ